MNYINGLNAAPRGSRGGGIMCLKKKIQKPNKKKRT